MFDGVRDFTNEKYNELMCIIDEDDEKEEDFFTNLFSGFTNSYDYDDTYIGNCLDDIGRYHEAIIQQKGTGKQDITDIFENVSDIDIKYSKKISDKFDIIEAFINQMQVFTNVMKEKKGSKYALDSNGFTEHFNLMIDSAIQKKIDSYAEKFYTVNDDGSYEIDMEYVEEFAHKDSECVSDMEKYAFASMFYIIDDDDYNTLEQIMSVSYTKLSDEDVTYCNEYEIDRLEASSSEMFTVEMSPQVQEALEMYCFDVSNNVIPLYDKLDAGEEKKLLNEQILKSGLFSGILEYGSVIHAAGVSSNGYRENDVKIDFSRMSVIQGEEILPVKISEIDDPQVDAKGYTLGIVQDYMEYGDEEDRGKVKIYDYNSVEIMKDSLNNCLSEDAINMLDSHKKDIKKEIINKALTTAGGALFSYALTSMKVADAALVSYSSVATGTGMTCLKNGASLVSMQIENTEIDKQTSKIDRVWNQSTIKYINACAISGQLVYDYDVNGNVKVYNPCMDTTKFRWRATYYKAVTNKDVSIEDVQNVYSNNSNLSSIEKVDEYYNWYFTDAKDYGVTDQGTNDVENVWYAVCEDYEIDKTKYNVNNFSDDAFDELVKYKMAPEGEKNFDLSVLD